VYLRHQEGTDQYERQQIAIQRKERHKSIDAARIGHEEAVQASRAYRGALTSAIKKKLADVATEFDQLDQTYGGYGAALQYDEPPPLKRARFGGHMVGLPDPSGVSENGFDTP
jgi:hypothetical protein